MKVQKEEADEKFGLQGQLELPPQFHFGDLLLDLCRA
jgi:hypothetical protein